MCRFIREDVEVFLFSSCGNQISGFGFVLAKGPKRRQLTQSTLLM